MKCAFLVRQQNREQVRQFRDAPAAIAQRRPAAEQEQTAAAAIDKLLDQLLLRGREIARFHRSDISA